ncbi:GcrA family cell cycle regulator [Modicisalibacter coralii]|uniref:GcrA family cell cycle regulator n=1 Tax=Modicisalibacter coralii TaxID=2304602 RepID=UPI00100B7CC1|nr:GcrA family cell cycle regulator [Halomonas coralii]
MPRKYRPWSRQEYDTLEALINEGLSYAQVAERMGRERMSVQGTAQRIGLTHPDRQGHQKRRDWPEIDRILEDCIETRLMTVPQATKHLKALGYRICQTAIYTRVGQDRYLRDRAIQNKRLRMAAVCRRNAARRKAAA